MRGSFQAPKVPLQGRVRRHDTHPPTRTGVSSPRAIRGDFTSAFSPAGKVPPWGGRGPEHLLQGRTEARRLHPGVRRDPRGQGPQGDPGQALGQGRATGRPSQAEVHRLAAQSRPGDGGGWSTARSESMRGRTPFWGAGAGGGVIISISSALKSDRIDLKSSNPVPSFVDSEGC